MDNITKALIALVIVLLGGSYVWSTLHFQSQGSPAGTTFSNAKFAAIAWSFLTSTSTSLYNSDASDRYITDMRVACTGIGTSQVAYTGAGLANWPFQAATSSSATASTTNSNLVFNTTIPTTTVGAVATISSTTQSLGAIPAFAVWPAGTYLRMYSIATNTAACVGGVDYIAG